MDMEELNNILSYVNNEGAKGRRFLWVEENLNMSGSSNISERFILFFDNGPSSATDAPWPL